jgi:hypothetical protein
MSNYTGPSIGGEANGFTGGIGGEADRRELALELFGGEVMETYDKVRVTQGAYQKQVVTEGKSFSFPEVGTAAAVDHFPGTEIDPSNIAVGERVISVHRMQISSVFVDDFDKAIMHWETRAPFVKQLGEALGNLTDKNVFRAMYAAAKDTASGDNLSGKSGVQIYRDDIVSGGTGIDFDSNVSDLLGAIYRASRMLDENDVPDFDDRTIWIAPASYYLLLTSGNDFTTASAPTIFNQDVGGEGSIARADVRMVAGMRLVKSNNLRQLIATDESGDTTLQSGLAHDFPTENLTALVNTPHAVGGVELIGMAVESERSVRHLGDLVVARQALGFGVLRPECAVAIRDENSV